MHGTSRRATVYFDSDLHQALRLKSAMSSRSISEIVNEAVRLSLADDAEDLAAFEQRGKELRLSFETLVHSVRKRAKS